MKNRSIKTSILIPALAALASGILAMVIIVGVLGASTANNLTQRLISARVNEYSNEFKSMCMDSYGIAESLAPVVERIAETSDNPRQEAIDTLSEVIQANSNMLGIWTCWEPDAFDGKDRQFAGQGIYDASGRYAPYIYKDGSSYKVEALVGYDDPIAGDYYQGVRKAGKPYITDPFYYSVNGNNVPLYTISIPIIKNGTVVGALGVDIMLDNLMTVMNSGSILDDGYIYTLSPSGVFATHSNKDVLMTSYDTTWMKNYSSELVRVMQSGGDFSIKAYSDVAKSDMVFLGSGVQIGNTGRYWVVCGVVPEKTVNASSVALVVTVIVIGIILILCVGAIIFLIVRKSLQDLPVLTATAEAMAVGDIDSSKLVAGTEPTENEVELLTRAFCSMSDGIRQQAGVLSRIAEGDYSMTVPVRSDADVMNKAINHMLDSTNNAMDEIRSTSAQVSSGADQIAQASQNLATGSSEQAATIEEFTATIADVQRAAEDNSIEAAKALEEVYEAGRLMGEATEHMNHMLEAMANIDESSQSISKVIKVIDDIAFQTNILALNAAVEAARAGQHGKGFAVVANEVRNLASKSAEAAKETAVLIESSVQSVAEGNSIVGRVNESMQNVSAVAEQSAKSLTIINTASQRQSVSMSEITDGIGQLSNVVQANSATAEETAASSEEMSAQANVLNKVIGRFKLRR